MKKRMIALVMALVVFCLTLSGCRRGSEYSDGTVSVPANWAKYSVAPMEFRFEAGYKSANWDTLTVESDEAAVTVGIMNSLAIYTRLQSPVMDQGTVNYLDFGYFEMGRVVSASDLEEVMTKIDELATSMKRLDVSADELQAARIRAYGDDELEALTCCYEVDYFLDQWTINCIVQVALVPYQNRIYLIAYSDFTTGEDDNTLERLLSTLKFVEPTS